MVETYGSMEVAIDLTAAAPPDWHEEEDPNADLMTGCGKPHAQYRHPRGRCFTGSVSQLASIFQAALTVLLTVGILALHARLTSLDIEHSRHLAGNSFFAAVEMEPRPDLIVIRLPGTEHVWVWTHSTLYTFVSPALLHALSCSMLDPEHRAVQLTQLPRGCEDPTTVTCLYSILDSDPAKPSTVDSTTGVSLAIQPHSASDGYFSLRGGGKDSVWKYTSSKLVAPVGADFEHLLWGLVMLVLVQAVAAGTAATYFVVRWLDVQYDEFIEIYVNKGIFLSDKCYFNHVTCQRCYMYNLRHLMEEHSSDTITEATVRDIANQSNALMVVHIRKQRCLLSMVKYHTSGSGAPSSALAAVFQAGSAEQISWLTHITRAARDATAQACFVGLPFVPLMLLQTGLRDGMHLFGQHALVSGVLPMGVVRSMAEMIGTLSTCSLLVLLVSVAVRGLIVEFNNQVTHGETTLLRNNYVRLAVVKWRLFERVWRVWVWVSLMLVALGVILALLGVVLHFFTNMFALTAAVGVIYVIHRSGSFMVGLWQLITAQMVQAEHLLDRIREMLNLNLIRLSMTECCADASADHSSHRHSWQANWDNLTDSDWKAMNDETVSLDPDELQLLRRAAHQKALLLIRSAFDRAVSTQLDKLGLSKTSILLVAMLSTSAVAAALLTVYLLMQAADAIRTAQGVASSAVSAAGIGIYAKLKGNKELKVDPKVEQWMVLVQAAIANAVEEMVREVCDTLLEECTRKRIEAVVDQVEKEGGSPVMITAARKGLRETKSTMVACLPKSRNATEAPSPIPF